MAFAAAQKQWSQGQEKGQGGGKDLPQANIYDERSMQQKMLEFQQEVGYAIVLYRRGDQHLRETPEHKYRRSKWRVSVPGPIWTSHKSNPLFGTNQMYEIIPFSRRILNQAVARPGGPQIGDIFAGVQPEHVREAIRNTRLSLEANSDFRIKKVLGWGGMGVVLMAELRQQRAGQRQNFVIKINMKDKNQEAFLQEKKNMIHMARAAHIIQSVVVQDNQQRKKKPLIGAPATKRKYPGDAADAPFQVAKKTRLTAGDEGGVVAAPAFGESPRQQLRQPLVRVVFDRAREAFNFQQATTRPTEGDYDINTHPDLMLIEPMSRGDFDMWVRKMATSGQKFHSKVLWLIFECLFKGVLGMAHPPRHYHDWRDTGGSTGPQVEERLPSRQDPIAFDRDAFAHFDLDLSNILVGDFNVPTQGSHSITPNIKIADLGLGVGMAKSKDEFFHMWGSRWCGKPTAGWLSPEQFHPEWDYIKVTPSTARNFRPTVAGQYSWKTNLYWVGQVMWCLVTLHKPSRMPFPYWINDTRAGQRRGVQKESYFWSWGGLVNHPRYNHIDEDLRAAITLCMADAPSMRPEAKELWDWIQLKTTSEWEDLSEGEARRWAGRFFETPGVPGPTGTTAFEKPGKQKVETPTAKKPRPPWGKIPDLAGISPSRQSHSTMNFDFSFKLPGQWPKNPSHQRVKQKKKPGPAAPTAPKPAGNAPKVAGIFPRFFRQQAAPSPADPAPQRPPQEQAAEPAAPAAKTPAAGAPPKKLSPKERIQAALKATARGPTPPAVFRQPPPADMKAGANAVAGRVRTFVVPSGSSAVTDSTAVTAAIAKDMVLATARARAEREEAPPPPTNKRLTRIGAGVQLIPHTQSNQVRGTPLQPNPPQKQVKFQTPAPVAADEAAPFLPSDLRRFRGKKAQQLLDMIDRHAAPVPVPGQRRTGGMYQPPQQQQSRPLQENQPPQPNWMPKQAQQVPQQAPVQRPQQILVPQQPQQPLPQHPQLKLLTAFILPNNQPGGSALPKQKPPGPPTPLVRRLKPVNGKVGGQYDIRGRRNNNIFRGPGPSRLQQAWSPLDLAEGGKAGRAGSGLFAGFKVQRGPTAGHAARPALLPEQMAEEAEMEAERIREATVPRREGPGSEQTSSSPRSGPSKLIVGWEHLPQELENPLTPQEIERRRLELERFHARNILIGGSLLGINWEDEESMALDEEMGDADGVREDADSQDPLEMSEPQQSTLSRFGSLFMRFGGFGRQDNYE